MAEITLKTTSGADAGTVELDDATFGVQPNVPLMHQVVTAQLAKRRAGTQSTKTRSEVRGGGAKPYRQKGTGNARQGSTNSPHYTGGGIALGPKPRSYAQRTPKKMIKQALRSALSDRANEGKVVVVDDWGLSTPKTKDARSALAALGVQGRSLVVVDRLDSPVALSFRNIPEVQLIKLGELNAYDVLCNDWIVFEQGSLPSTDAPPRRRHPGLASVPLATSRPRPIGLRRRELAPARRSDSQQPMMSRPPAERRRRGGRPTSDRTESTQMKDPRDIIIAPVVSEKSYALMETGIYTFKVRPSASKPEIRDAVESIWGVEVSKVNTLNRKGKRRRTRGTNRTGTKPDTKRAMVTLAAGEIPLFEN